MTATDAALLRQWARDRDATAFHRLVSNYVNLVYSTARRIVGNDHDAEEVAQECFLALARKPDAVRSSLGAWLHQVATSRSLDRVRSDARRRRRETDFAGSIPAVSAAGWDDVKVYVDEAISALPDELRVPIVAHFLEGQAQARIAEEYGLTQQAISARIERGIKEVRGSLRRRGIEVAGGTLASLLADNAIVHATHNLQNALAKLAIAGLAGTRLLPVLGNWTPTATVAVSSTIALATVVTVAAWLGLRPERTGTDVSVSSGPRLNPATGTVQSATLRGPDETVGAVASQALPSQTPDTTDTSAARGPGVIRGSLTIPNMPLPPSIEVSMLLVDWPYHAPWNQTYTTRFSQLNRNGTFEFGDLPLGRYAYLMTGSGFSSAGVITLTPLRPVASFSTIAIRGAPVPGKVIDPEGRPVSGAEVYLGGHNLFGREETNNPVLANASRRITDGDGRFQFPPVYQGIENRYVVKAPGYANFVSEPIESGQDPVTFQLDRGGAITGRVVDANSGEPLAGVTVGTLVKLTIDRVDTVAAADGTYTFSNLREGDAVISIFDDELVSRDGPATIHVASGATSEGPTLVASRGATIEGQFVDETTGWGVPGAAVYITYPGDEHPPWHLVSKYQRTDAEGKYRFSGLEAGSYEIWRDTIPGYLGYCPQSFESRVRGMPPRLPADPANMRTVEVSTGERATGIDLELRPGLDLAGRVEDANGRGIEGVQIKAIARGGAESAIRTEITGPAGDFVFLGFERGSNVQLSIDDPNVYFQRREAVTLDSEVPPYVTIVAGRAAEIEGTVRDEQGSPVSGVAVHAVPISSRDSRTWYSRTEPSGSFRIVGLPPGEYRIACLNSYSAVTPGDADALRATPTWPSKAVQLEEGQIQEGVALLYPGPKPLLTSGRVVDELGRPVANAQIQGSLGIEFITNSDGRFEIPGLPEGQHSYYVWVPRHTSRSATITAGRTNQDIVVASSGRVTGRVIDARTGAPVTNYTIAVHGQNHVQAVNDPAGEFTMYPGGGTAGLVVRAHGYAHTLHAIAPLAANETRVGLIISLQPGSTLSGMVVNSDGMAVPNAAVSARGLSTTADHSTGTTSDYFGRFVLQGVPIGSIEVAVMCNGYEPVTETIKIANGAANEVTVTLHPTTN